MQALIRTSFRYLVFSQSAQLGISAAAVEAVTLR